jgi:hypothetical protein
MIRLSQALLAAIPKTVLPVAALGGLVIVSEPYPFSDMTKLMIEFGMFLAGIIGVAAVMRVDVGRLVQWQMKHVNTHEQLTIAITKLTTISEETERRLERLEEEKNHGR